MVAQRKFPRWLGLATCVAALSGCVTVTQHPMDPAAGNNLKDRTVSSVTHMPPDFAAFTPTKAAFGILGAAAMVSAGKAFIKDNGIEDPAPRIADELVHALGDKYHMAIVSSKTDVIKDNEPASAAAASGADYVVDVQTMGWSYSYLPTGWTHYRVNYIVRMRLIDAHSAQIVAEGGCTRSPSDEKDTASFDTLEANHGQWVKDTLKAYSAICVDEFKKTVGLANAAG